MKGLGLVKCSSLNRMLQNCYSMLKLWNAKTHVVFFFRASTLPISLMNVNRFLYSKNISNFEAFHQVISSQTAIMQWRNFVWNMSIYNFSEKNILFSSISITHPWPQMIYIKHMKEAIITIESTSSSQGFFQISEKDLKVKIYFVKMH